MLALARMLERSGRHPPLLLTLFLALVFRVKAEYVILHNDERITYEGGWYNWDTQ
jgi:hypothetical protein